MRFRTLGVLILVACGGDGSSALDAATDAPPDTTLPPKVTYRYVMASQQQPMNNNQARELGLDLNGDKTVDNQLGMVMGTLTGQGLRVQEVLTAEVDVGDVLVLAQLDTDSLVQSVGAAQFTMYRGAMPNPPSCAGAGDTVCRKHLQGTASFQVAATSARDTPLGGAIVNGVLQAGPGKLQLITTFANPQPIALDLIGARVKLSMLGDGTIGAGVIGGGVTMFDRDTKIYPALQTEAMRLVNRDCTNTTPPDCGCGAGTDGKSWLGLFDTTPKNCSISLSEIQNNSLIVSLFAPDVTIDGQNVLSIGVGFTAVKGTFTP